MTPELKRSAERARKLYQGLGQRRIELGRELSEAYAKMGDVRDGTKRDYLKLVGISDRLARMYIGDWRKDAALRKTLPDTPPAETLSRHRRQQLMEVVGLTSPAAGVVDADRNAKRANRLIEKAINLIAGAHDVDSATMAELRSSKAKLEETIDGKVVVERHGKLAVVVPIDRARSGDPSIGANGTRFRRMPPADDDCQPGRWPGRDASEPPPTPPESELTRVD